MSLWPVLTFLSLAALIGVHFWWRKKFLRDKAKLLAESAAIRREQEDILQQAAAQEEILLNAMLEGLLLLDRNRRIRLANRAFEKLFSLSGDVRGKTVMEALRLHELASLVEQVEAKGQVLDFEINLPEPNGRHLQVNAATIADTVGELEGVILVFHDLTRLKQLEATRQEFVANVSHELRTPLAMIKGYTETLLAGAKDDPATAMKFLQTVERHSNRLTLLIEDLLTISSLESGQIQLRHESIGLPGVVEKVFADLKPRAEARGVKLTNQVPPLIASADTNRLHQVLSNLVDNAIKYGHAEGEVVVSGRETGDGHIEISVGDNGPGIPAEALDRIFERFYRVDKARSREQGGTGLGLSIVKHIVQAHGGKVWAASELGNGTTFFFTLSRG